MKLSSDPKERKDAIEKTSEKESAKEEANKAMLKRKEEVEKEQEKIENDLFWTMAYIIAYVARVIVMWVFIFNIYQPMLAWPMHQIFIFLIPIVFGVWPFATAYWLYSVGFIGVPIFTDEITRVLSVYLATSVLEYALDWMMCRRFEEPPTNYKLNQMLKVLNKHLNQFRH